MKFICLGYADEKKWDALSKSEIDAMIEECFVYDDVIDTGSAANLMLRAAGKEVQFKQLAAYFLDHQALDPIVAIRGLYHVERDGTVAAGDFKLTVMPRQELPVLCMHDAPGYAKSFARVTADFAKSFQFKSEQPAPMRGELWVVTLEGSPIGFSRETTYKLEDGNVRKVTLGADYSKKGRYYNNLCNSPQIATDDYENLNAQLAYETGDGRWRVTASGTNLTDKVYWQGGFDLSAALGDAVYVVPPRMWQVAVRYSFD